MKKTYQIPTTKVVKIQAVQMIAATQLGIGDTVTTASDAESRQGGSFWDDDDYAE